MHVTFSYSFFHAKTRTSNFRQVMQQHTEGMAKSIICILLEMYFSLQQLTNVENPFRIDKVIAMSLVYYFFGRQCTMNVTYDGEKKKDEAQWCELTTAPLGHSPLGHNSTSLQPYVGRLGSVPRLVSRIGSGVRVSASLKKSPVGSVPLQQKEGYDLRGRFVRGGGEHGTMLQRRAGKNQGFLDFF